MNWHREFPRVRTCASQLVKVGGSCCSNSQKVVSLLYHHAPHLNSYSEIQSDVGKLRGILCECFAPGVWASFWFNK